VYVSKVCSSSFFHIRALRHICPSLDWETSKTIACAIICSRLDYVNAILTSISSRNIHHHRLKFLGSSHYLRNCQHHLSSKFTSLEAIEERINFKLFILVHRSLGPQYLSSLLHPYTPSHQLHSASLNLLLCHVIWSPTNYFKCITKFFLNICCCNAEYSYVMLTCKGNIDKFGANTVCLCYLDWTR